MSPDGERYVPRLCAEPREAVSRIDALLRTVVMMVTGNNRMTSQNVLSTQRSQQVSRDLEAAIEQLAPTLMANVPENDHFAKHPDSVEEHHVDWHQYGIITHTKKVREAYHNELMPLLNAWGLADKVSSYLSQSVGSGWTRGELLEISIPVHDLGKFARSHFYKDGKAYPDYVGHEAISEQIVLSNERVKGILASGGLMTGEISHVAALAGLHFELGKVRDVARSRGGYNLAFAKSSSATETFTELRSRHPNHAPEIGLWYIVDSMGKISLRCDADNDEALAASRPQRESDVAAAGLRPSLLNALIQYPVNLHVAREYLKQVL